MNLVHSLHYSAGQCGLYETASELIVAEREAGIEATAVDPNNARAGDSSLLADCDVIVDHSGLTEEMYSSGKPIIHIRHGRPHNTYLLEKQEKFKVFSHLWDTRKLYTKIVTFWKEHVPYLRVMFDRKTIDVISPTVDFKRYSIDGEKTDFHGKQGEFNIVYCFGASQKDVDVFHLIIACGMLPKKFRLHLYGLRDGMDQAMNVLWNMIGDNAGAVHSWVKDMAPAYRSADLAIVPHNIATRGLREAMSCGCPVVGQTGNLHSKYTANMSDAVDIVVAIISAFDEKPDRNSISRIARESFDPKDSARQFIDIVKSVIPEDAMASSIQDS